MTCLLRTPDVMSSSMRNVSSTKTQKYKKHNVLVNQREEKSKKINKQRNDLIKLLLRTEEESETA